MPEMTSFKRVVRFGDFEVDLQTGDLSKRGVKVRIRQQLFTVLSALLARAGDVVTREELQKRLWPGDTYVDFEIDLNAIIARLREALGDSAENPRYIETLPKRGYRFLAAVSEGSPPPGAASRRIRLVVLPLSNTSGDAGEEYFSDAMTDELITAFCQFAPERLAVIARTTAMRYKHGGRDVPGIGRELGVDYIVEGGVRRGQNRMTMNLRLIPASDQSRASVRTYEAELGDFDGVVRRAASDLAAVIGIPAMPDGASLDATDKGRLPQRAARDLAAYNEFIQGRHHMSVLTAEGLALAKNHLERAVARDPGFAPAYDALAEVQWYLGYMGYISAKEAFSAGIISAMRAIELDGALGETHALLGQFHKTIKYDWPEVRREMELALRLDPASPFVRLRYAVSDLMPHGRLEEAIVELEKALESDPLSMLAQGWMGIMLVLAHKWDEAVDQGRRLLQLFPGVIWGHFVMGVAYREKHAYGEAIAALRRAAEVSGGMPLSISWLGLTLGLSGNPAEARALLRGLHASAAVRYVPPTSFAWIHLGLGELDAAFEWLNRAVDECDQLMMPIKSYKFFDPIRSDPRFRTLLRKMNLDR